MRPGTHRNFSTIILAMAGTAFIALTTTAMLTDHDVLAGTFGLLALLGFVLAALAPRIHGEVRAGLNGFRFELIQEVVDRGERTGHPDDVILAAIRKAIHDQGPATAASGYERDNDAEAHIGIPANTTYLGGAPGGYPGQGPQQPPHGPGYGPPAGGVGFRLSLAQLLRLVGAGLGLVNVFLGFAAMAPGGGQGTNLYEEGIGWLPILFFVGGLLAINRLLPGGSSLGVAPAVIVLGALVAQLMSFSVIPETADVGAGFVIMLIVGVLELSALVLAYLIEAGIVKLPPPASPFGQPGGYASQSGQFPPQPGAPSQFPPQQGQFGQPGQPTPSATSEEAADDLLAQARRTLTSR